jgi:N-acyl-D-aspartate/D-glutamate deacylase
MRKYDLIIKGGRVVDPAAGVDGVYDVAIEQHHVAAVGHDLDGRVVVDATGCVVAPGFIDLHSHAQSLAGNRLQALDGVTTSLDLEGGVASVDSAYALAASQGRILHYGFSASWGAARMETVGGIEVDDERSPTLSHLGDAAWQRPASERELEEILRTLSDNLDQGGLGIGILLAYAPGTSSAEYERVAALAAAYGQPTYTHARDLREYAPNSPIDGAEEIVRVAEETGAHMHYCHLNSTSLRAVDRVLGLVTRARQAGSTITTEAYPYGAASTNIGASFLHPDRIGARGLESTNIVYARTGESVASVDRLRELRASDPGGICIVHFLDEENPADLDTLMKSLEFPRASIASDAMTLTWRGSVPAPNSWPLPDTAFAHPRTAGTFSRAYRRLVAERQSMDLGEFISRASVYPASVLRTASRGTVGKGTLSLGSDADIVVFNPTQYADCATYQVLAPSLGVRYLLVAGQLVIDHGELVLDARPGRPVRAA